jgi:prepilin-type N-terminal cleavage/methylation domain-containing protein
MNYELRTNKGLTLTEMTVVVAVAAMLTALSMPAVRTFFSSMATSGDTRTLISASLASARAIAAKEQRYAGIRFQKAYDPKGPLYAPQYMIFIVHDYDKTGLANGFRAVEGIQPIKLSDDVGVIDASLGTAINDPNTLINATTFSIIFSPSGKLVIHPVRAKNRDGKPRWPDPLDNSQDDIFNSSTNIITYQVGMFIQDGYANLGLLEEPSRNGFVIYEADKFKQAYSKGNTSGYLSQLKLVYINPYTGTIVNNQ